MPIELPTSTDLKVRYAEFTLVSDSLIDEVIGEAAHMVDEGWLEQDRKPALLAYTAHLLWLEGYPARATNPLAPIPAHAGREVIQRRVGDVSTQYAQSTSVTSGPGIVSTLKHSPYGQRFAQLLRLNAPTFQVL